MSPAFHVFRVLPIIVYCFLLGSGSYAGNPAFEFSTSGATVDNLLSDSTELADAYATSQLKFDLYPLSSLELNLTGEHSQYGKIIGLTSNYGSVGLTFIPLKATSPLSIYLAGHLNGRKYHNDFSLFDNNGGDIMAAVGYRPIARLLLRTGISFTSTAYINSDIPYKRDLELFAGSHFSLPASNSLDIEIGYARSNYEYIDAYGRLTDSMTFIDSLIILSQPPDSADNVAEKLKTVYYSIRLSRPLPLKSGLSLIYTNRIFQNDNHNIVYGFTTGYLSPWATLWDGENIALKFKSFILPGVILTSGIGYWDKTYLRTAENDDATIRHLENNKHRRDFLTRWYIGTQLPIVSNSGWFLEQNIKVESTSNRSTQPDIYTYQNISVTAGFVVRF